MSEGRRGRGRGGEGGTKGAMFRRVDQAPCSLRVWSIVKLAVPVWLSGTPVLVLVLSPPPGGRFDLFFLPPLIPTPQGRRTQDAMATFGMANHNLQHNNNERELMRRFEVQKFLGKGSYGSVYVFYTGGRTRIGRASPLSQETKQPLTSLSSSQVPRSARVRQQDLRAQGDECQAHGTGGA